MSMSKMNKEYNKFLKNANKECFSNTHSKKKEYESNLEAAYKNVNEDELKDIYLGLFVIDTNTEE